MRVQDHGTEKEDLRAPEILATLFGIEPVDANRPGWLGKLDRAAAEFDSARTSTESNPEYLGSTKENQRHVSLSASHTHRPAA